MVSGEGDAVLIVDGEKMDWGEHPRFQNIFMKTLLTSTHNPFANLSQVRVPVGASVPRHVHPNEIETVFILAGESQLVLGSEVLPFSAGSAVAIPKGLEHELHNVGEVPVELLAFFTPPLS